ncbi:MAG TPA: hypothetical protein VFG37_04190 [Planctomycetota bacterium]|nr:hypothetical protein [Planctomycetota bacterium]
MAGQVERLSWRRRTDVDVAARRLRCAGHRYRLEYCRMTGDSLDGELIKSVDFEAAFKDPREVIRLILYLSPIDFPEPGEYRIMLVVGEVVLAERRILAMPVPGTAS